MDKGSLENKFKAMNMPELKKFLQYRGITVNSYLKPGLVAIACAVEEMNLPPQCQTTEAEEKLNMYIYTWPFVSKWVRDIWALIQCIFFTKHFKRIMIYVCLLDACICVFLTHITNYKTRIYMRTKHAYVCIQNTHIFAYQ